MNTLKTLPLAAVIASLALAPHAEAHKVQEKQARKAVQRAAQKAATDTNATSFKIKSCKRLSRHKWQCLVALFYSEGVTRCELPITVSAKTHKSTKLARELGATTCY